MAAHRTDMDRLQELVRLHRMGTGARETARLLGMGPNTERMYREALKAAELWDGAADGLPTLEVLKQAVLTHRPPKKPPQLVSTAERWTDDIEAMMKRGATPTAIFDTLRSDKEKKFDAKLSAVKRLCARLKKNQPIRPEDVAIPVPAAPGQVAQVDFGYVGRLLDPEQQRMRRAWVFVMVLMYSRHRFDRVVFDQSSETWLRLHIEAFEKWRGVPGVVRPDNLKAAVLRAAFGLCDCPTLNRSYRELARHYGFKIDPTPRRARWRFSSRRSVRLCWRYPACGSSW